MMIKRKQGQIVSMSSIAGAMGCENVVPYSASKFAVRGMMEALTEEIRRDSRQLDIKCTTVCPFVVDTGLCKRPRVKYEVSHLSRLDVFLTTRSQPYRKSQRIKLAVPLIGPK